MREKPVYRVVDSACGRVGRAAQTAGTLLAALSLLVGVAFAGFAPVSLEERIASLLLFGLLPAFGFYLSGLVIRHTLVLSCKLCATIAARCFGRLAAFASSLGYSADVPGSDPFDTLMQKFCCFGQKTFCSVRRSYRRVQTAALELLFLLIRTAARFIIEMQAISYSAVGRQICHELRAILWRSDHWHELRTGRTLSVIILTTALLAALGLGWFGGSGLYWVFDRKQDELTDRPALNTVIERIIDVESGGNPNAKNERSSAAGPAQFLNDTWLEMIRAYRPDLSRGRSEGAILELRRDPNLAREIATRLAERNATMLKRRGLPVTPGTVYLAHFAGGAGAIAILSAPEDADAALVMASADATGRTKREKIIRANPFLERFTVADLKIWADRKMRGLSPRLAVLRASDVRQ